MKIQLHAPEILQALQDYAFDKYGTRVTRLTGTPRGMTCQRLAPASGQGGDETIRFSSSEIAEALENYLGNDPVLLIEGTHYDMTVCALPKNRCGADRDKSIAEIICMDFPASSTIERAIEKLRVGLPCTRHPRKTLHTLKDGSCIARFQGRNLWVMSSNTLFSNYHGDDVATDIKKNTTDEEIAYWFNAQDTLCQAHGWTLHSDLIHHLTAYRDELVKVDR